MKIGEFAKITGMSLTILFNPKALQAAWCSLDEEIQRRNVPKRIREKRMALAFRGFDSVSGA